MDKIEFSHKYTKLPDGIKTAVLIACEPVRGEEQVSAFIQYDTSYRYYNTDIEGDEELWINYKQGDYLCLVLKSDTGAIFTTLRKDNGENREKYMIAGTWGWLRPEFQIIIKEGRE